MDLADLCCIETFPDLRLTRLEISNQLKLTSSPSLLLLNRVRDEARVTFTRGATVAKEAGARPVTSRFPVRILAMSVKVRQDTSSAMKHENLKTYLTLTAFIGVLLFVRALSPSLTGSQYSILHAVHCALEYSHLIHSADPQRPTDKNLCAD